MKISRLKCGCRVTEEGYYYSACKYHETHCHWFDCRKKINQEIDNYYCELHSIQATEEAKMSIDSFGGSDF